jgi:CRP-like cAMP-binding protein
MATPTPILSSEELRRIPIFSELTDDEAAEVIRFCRVKRVRRNAPIFFAGDACNGFYAVLSGSVKAFKESPEGKELVVHVLEPGQMFGEVPMFEERIYPVSTMALEASIMLFVPRAEFLSWLERHPALYRKLLVGFAKKIREITSTLEDVIMRDVVCRFSRYLLRELEARGKLAVPTPSLRLPASKSVIAHYLGTALETLSRTLRRLQEEKVIDVRGAVIRVLNLPRLRQLGL